MKKKLLKLILPLTIISFVVFTKWWYVSPVDAPNSIMIGFPIPYSCNGWHTSMSEQFFLIEFLFDLCVYFLFWSIAIYIFNRFVFKIGLNRLTHRILNAITILILLVSLVSVFMPENVVYINRNFDIEIKETQYKFIWEQITRPELREEIKQ